MKLFVPPVLIVAVSLLPGTEARCWFGDIVCRDGSRHCLNPLTVAYCAFDAISPITIDSILSVAGEQLNHLTDDPIAFAIELGEQAVNDVFNDARDCYKLLAGKETTCNELNGVKSCLNTALTLWPATKLAKGAKLSATNLKRAEDAMDAMASKVIPALDAQCINGCLGGQKCGTTSTYSAPSPAPSPAPAPIPAPPVDCQNTSTASTPSVSPSPTPTPAPEEPPVTLIYSPPTGCTCKNVTLSLPMKDSEAKTIDTCARNAIFFMAETNLQMNKIYYKDMGCFVGKSPDDEASYSLCAQAELATQDMVELRDDEDWLYSNTQFHMFVPCVDQFGRTYSQRNESVPASATPTPTPTPPTSAPTPTTTTRPLCNSMTQTPTTTTQTTPTTTTATTGAKPSSAHSIKGDWSRTIIVLYLGLLAVSSLALLTHS